MALRLDSDRCLVIAEVAQAHDGSLDLAHAYLDAVADAGADAVKFQTHLAAAESTPREPWRTKFSRREETRYEYWRRMEFLPEEWRGLKDHADERGLLFLSSPFSLEAVELLERVGVAGWKIASGEVANGPLFDAIAGTGLPVLLSTGMSPWAEIDAAVARVRAHELPLAVLQCTSMYPTPPEKVGLNVISELRERYGCAVGLSDHTGTIYAGLAAAALGIEVLEVHVALSREVFSPDLAVSVTTEELRTLVEGVRAIERMRAPVDKDAAARELAGMRRLFTKSLVARRALARGTRLEEKDVALKKPGTGLPPEKLPEVLGRRLTRDLDADAPILEEDLE